jgi:hypothetical protein
MAHSLSSRLILEAIYRIASRHTGTTYQSGVPQTELKYVLAVLISDREARDGLLIDTSTVIIDMCPGAVYDMVIRGCIGKLDHQYWPLSLQRGQTVYPGLNGAH